jgi:membrane carboxypeptidase/penicillin-binding protein PbpC
MQVNEIVQALSSKNKGAFFSVTILKNCATLKSATEVVEKETRMTVQFCDYSARAAVKNAVEDGTREAPELPSHIEKTFTEGNVKFWQGRNGTIYMPLPLAGSKSTAHWYLNGEEVPYKEVEPYLLASEKPKVKKDKEELAEKGQVPFVAPKIENIIRIA